MTQIAWEEVDGSCGHFSVPDEDADAIARELAEDRPHARIWIDDDIYQRGFIADDERSDA